MRKGATSVGMAVSISRLAGLLRERVFAHYLGTSESADAFIAAFRIPTLVESLFGDRVVSSAFIPRYSGLLAQGADDEARHLARVVGSIQIFVVTIVVGAGMTVAPLLVGLIAPGFGPEKTALTISLVRILFPAAGLLVLGSWCLGVLNSHRRFFLPFVVPVLSAVSITVALVWTGRSGSGAQIAVGAAWGAVVGAALQVGAQLPPVLRRLRGPTDKGRGKGHAAAVGRNALPAMARGVVGRTGAWVEVAIAGFVSTGAIAALGYAQMLYALPVGLFSVAISAALLPELSAVTVSGDDRGVRLARGLETALRHTAFLLVPCAVAFVVLGDVVVGAVYQGGEFTAADVTYVWAILAASSVGLVGASMGGVYATAFYALGDTVSPLKASLVRLLFRTLIGAVLALPVTRWLELDPRWGAVGLGAALGIGGWVEYTLLRAALRRRFPDTRGGSSVRYMIQLWGLALGAAALAFALKVLLGPLHPVLLAAAVLSVFGSAYAGGAILTGVAEAGTVWSELRNWLRR